MSAPELRTRLPERLEWARGLDRLGAGKAIRPLVGWRGRYHGCRSWRRNALKGCAGNFEKHLRLDASGCCWVVPVARFGYIARALVFFIMGVFLLVAAWQTNSGRAKGLGGALDVLAAQPYGWMLLGATALGLAAFGAFGLIQARFRYIDSSATRWRGRAKAPES